ncbi:MAG: hypothetical protein H6581_16470 [Bacteroidia bacterium]|nr:hypothetical protein [Bacteroidia bacterium]
MYIHKNFPLTDVLRFSWFHLVWITLWAAAAVSIYQYLNFEWLAIPWLPVSLVGTAVAFYLGFKNNSAYDRLWEARKIWGGIVNDSRTWGTMVKNYLTNQFRESNLNEGQLKEHHRRLVYRHIAWLYTLRHQLLKVTPWEHVNSKLSAHAAVARESAMLRLFNFPDWETEMKRILPAEEFDKIKGFANPATQLIDQQSIDLKKLREIDLIDDFRHMELQKLMGNFYTLQGQAERIKNFPLPRQYGSVSFYFVALFMLLLPFGMIGEFKDLGNSLIWLSVPFTALVGWVFIMMELIGDYSENPFERMANDIPMYALSRTIEIDLREMLGETDLPPKIEGKRGILL